MFKKILLFGAVAVLLGAGVFLFFTKKGIGRRAQTAVYTFTSLPAGVAAQVELKDSTLTGQSVLTIHFEDILDEHYKSLVGKQQELLFLAGYEQFLKPRASTFKTASFKLQKPARPISQVCSQYGIPCERASDISFDPQQKDFLVMDKETFALGKLEQNTVPLLGVKSEVLNYLLQRIDENARAKLFYFLAKKDKIDIQEYFEQKILSEKDLEAISLQELVRQNPQITSSEKTAALGWMKDVKKNQAIDEHLRTNMFNLPIKVNIEKPSHDFKTRWDWTPFFGEKPGSAVDVVLFVDAFSDASRSAVRQYLRQMDFGKNATFGVRPYFPAVDPLQWLAAEISMCVWKHNKNIYWKFLELSYDAKRDSVESDLYAAVTKAGGSMDVVRACATSREMKKVVEYHLQSAKYLKIINAPVYFIGNEVVVGPLSGNDFEKMLNRQ